MGYSKELHDVVQPTPMTPPSPVRIKTPEVLRTNPRIAKWRKTIKTVRVLQIFLFIICYVFARTVLEIREWNDSPLETGLYTTLFTLLIAILVRCLYSHVPWFLRVTRLKPDTDGKSITTFFSVLASCSVRHSLVTVVEDTKKVFKVENPTLTERIGSDAFHRDGVEPMEEPVL